MSIATLEEVFIKINEELAPELFEKVDKSGRCTGKVKAIETLQNSEIKDFSVLKSDLSILKSDDS